MMFWCDAEWLKCLLRLIYCQREENVKFVHHILSDQQDYYSNEFSSGSPRMTIMSSQRQWSDCNNFFQVITKVYQNFSFLRWKKMSSVYSLAPRQQFAMYHPVIQFWWTNTLCMYLLQGCCNISGSIIEWIRCIIRKGVIICIDVITWHRIVSQK